jgi:hypothetical protein
MNRSRRPIEDNKKYWQRRRVRLELPVEQRIKLRLPVGSRATISPPRMAPLADGRSDYLAECGEAPEGVAIAADQLAGTSSASATARKPSHFSAKADRNGRMRGDSWAS